MPLDRSIHHQSLLLGGAKIKADRFRPIVRHVYGFCLQSRGHRCGLVVPALYYQGFPSQVQARGVYQGRRYLISLHLVSLKDAELRGRRISKLSTYLNVA